MIGFGSLVLILLLALSGPSLGAPLDDRPPGECPDGSPNGAQSDRGRFYYECDNGEIVPKGCITDELKKIEIGQTTDKRTYRLRCTLSSDKLLALEPFACLHQGAEHKLDEQWEDGTNFYTCKSFDKEMRPINSGCVDQGKRIPLNENIAKDEFVMTCNTTVNNGARLMPTGCIKEGRQYNAGDSFDVGKFWYTCTRTGREKVALKASGCVNNGRRLNDGDRFSENDVVYECTIESGKTDVRVVGCAQTDESGKVVERRMGCTWTEGQAPFQYEVGCREEQGSVKKIQIRCTYNIGAGSFNIDPGCYRLIEKSAFGCLQDGSALRLQSFQGDNAGQTAAAAGLHAC